MQWNAFDYLHDGQSLRLYRKSPETEEMVRFPPDLVIESALLMPVFLEMHKYSQRIYVQLLSMLEDNNKPIVVRASQLKVMSTPRITDRRVFDHYVRPLIQSGLIARPGRNMYYINPVFAWKKGSESCFNPKYVPVIHPEEAQYM